MARTKGLACYFINYLTGYEAYLDLAVVPDLPHCGCRGRAADAVEELRGALRLDPLSVAAHRILGYALAATGRFGEAVEQWDQWERLAAHSEAELAQSDAVHRAKAAAQTLAGTGNSTHG